MSEIEIPLADPQRPEIENAKVHLVIERGEARSRVREVNGPLFLIGSNEDADLVLGDDQFAEYHAYICVRGNEVTLRHLGNPPEVTVNGRIVRWGELRHGDRLRMGPYQFRLSIVPIVPDSATVLPVTPEFGQPARQPNLPAWEQSPDTKKRWAAHTGSIHVAPTPELWKKTPGAPQVVGWFDELEES